MAGRIKRMIDLIIECRAKGNLLLTDTTKAKLIFKGVNPDAFTALSPDDPRTEERVRIIAAELGVSL
jgi:hypothetical protein